MDCIRQLRGLGQSMMPDGVSLCCHLNRCSKAMLSLLRGGLPASLQGPASPSHRGALFTSNVLPNEAHVIHSLLSYPSRASLA